MAEDALGPRLRRRPSISDVAAAAGVSRAAVSKVIRGAYGVSPTMRARVETAIEHLGYRPRVAARAMRGASFTIGFEVPHPGNEFFWKVMEGAATSLAASNYQLIVAPGLGYLSGTTVLDALVDRQVDGLIETSDQVTASWLEHLAEHVPLVVLGRHDRSREYDTVTNDDRTGANLVMDHLRELGHERIAHLTIRPSTAEAPHAIRLAAYRDRMEREGLEPRIAYLASSDDGAYETAREMLESHVRPTAIFAGHDALAIDVLRAISDQGLTAADVSVVGYDDIDLAQHPLISLTTVDQFGVAMGSTAIEMLMERIRDGRREPRHHRIDPRLRVRRSTRPL